MTDPKVEPEGLLVVLDANILLADPTFRGIVWRVLAQAPASWNVRIVVPRVAVAETKATIGRQANDAIAAVRKGADTMRRLGLPVPDTLVPEALLAARGLDQDFLTQLDNRGIDIVDPPAINHMELVERATARRKPCNDKGDGYRDTLIWLTVIELAQQTDDPIAFVSNNVNDFADLPVGDIVALHPHLLEDLAAADVADRVHLFRKLDDLAIGLATKHSPTAASDLREVDRELERAQVVDYINLQVIPALSGRSVRPSACALPRHVTTATIDKCGDPVDIEIVAVEPIGTESLARFTFTATCHVSARSHDDAALEDEDDVDEEEIVVKQLKISGILTRDQFQRPTSAEVTEIAALPGDPGLAAWAARADPWQAGFIAQQIWQGQDGARTIADIQKISAGLAGSPALKAMADAQRLTAGLAGSSALKGMADARRLTAGLAGSPALQAMADARRLTAGLAGSSALQAMADARRLTAGLAGSPALKALADAQRLTAGLAGPPAREASKKTAKQPSKPSKKTAKQPSKPSKKTAPKSQTPTDASEEPS